MTMYQLVTAVVERRTDDGTFWVAKADLVRLPERYAPLADVSHPYTVRAQPSWARGEGSTGERRAMAYALRDIADRMLLENPL